MKKNAPVAAQYALEVSRRLREATDGRPLATVAEEAAIARSTLYDLLQGRTWADLQSLAKLESVLGRRLWPNFVTDRTRRT